MVNINLADKLRVRNTICCLTRKKECDTIVSTGVVKLNKVSNKNSPKKKKKDQKKNNMYDVVLDVITVL
jgi:hypothetical protein